MNDVVTHSPMQPSRFAGGQVLSVAHAVGAATLVFPFYFLWQRFEELFLGRALRKIAEVATDVPLEDLLEQHGLSCKVMKLDEAFAGYSTKARTITWTAAGLRKLAEHGDDLDDDEGRWKDEAQDLEVPAREALEKLRDLLEKLVATIQRDFGFTAARFAIQSVRDLFTRYAVSLEPPRRISSEQLRKAVEKYKTASKPRKFYLRIATRLWPNLSTRWWLTEAEMNALSGECLRTINQAAAIRYGNELRQAKRTIFQELLGHNRRPGILDELLEKILRHANFYDELISVTSMPLPSARFHEVRLADSLFVEIAPRQTIAHLWLAWCKQFGRTSTELAESLSRDGIVVNGRRYLPGEWPQCDRPELRRALQLAMKRYLGSTNPSQKLDTTDPQSAVEYVASFGLSHPAYRELVETGLSRLIELSRPYCVTDAIADLDPKPLAYLFSYPAEREHWLGKINGRLAIADKAAGRTDGACYAMPHPFAVKVLQFGMGVPLGALADLPLWRHALNQQRLGGQLPILFDHREKQELGILVRRPACYRDAGALVDAAVKGQILVELPNTPGCFVLCRPDRRLDKEFSPDRFAPKWLLDDEIVHLLQSSIERHQLRIHFPAVSHSLEKLAVSIDAATVCQALVSSEVLEGGKHRLYRLRFNGQPKGELSHWFERVPSSLAGLSKDDLVQFAYADAVFYSVLFFGIMDAIEEKKLGPADLPDFLLTYWKKLVA